MKSAPLDTAVHLPRTGARSGKRSKSALASAACVTKTDAGPLPHLATPSTHPSQCSMAGTPSTGEEARVASVAGFDQRGERGVAGRLDLGGERGCRDRRRG